MQNNFLMHKMKIINAQFLTKEQEQYYFFGRNARKVKFFKSKQSSLLKMLGETGNNLRIGMLSGMVCIVFVVLLAKIIFYYLHFFFQVVWVIAVF